MILSYTFVARRAATRRVVAKELHEVSSAMSSVNCMKFMHLVWVEEHCELP